MTTDVKTTETAFVKIKAIFLLLFILSIILLMAPGVKAQSLPLIYSGNLDGELEPCGCTEEGNMGGINRHVSAFDKLRAENPQMVAVSSGGLIAAEGSTDHIKAKYILQGFTSLNYDAIGLQWKDLSFGTEFLAHSQLPWVVSNWGREGVLKEKTISRSLGGETVNLKIFSWLDPGESPTRQMHESHSLVRDDAARIKEAIAAADAQGFLTVLLTSLPLEAVKERFGLKTVDIVLVRSAYEVFGDPRQDGKTLVLQPGSRGMRLGRVDISLDAKGDIAKWTHEVIALPTGVADSPRMAAWYAAYNDEVKQDYLKRVEIRKQLQSGASPYAGEETCKTCHVDEHKIWLESQHAIAFEELEGVNKAFDSACIGCHTLGFGEAGGYVDISLTPDLINVQCENCHGAGKQHVESKGAKPVANKGWSKEKMCGQCHVQKHSPSFSIDQYWPKIVH